MNRSPVIVNQPNTVAASHFPRESPEPPHPKHEGLYCAPQPPYIGYDASGIPSNLLPLVYADYLVIKQKREWLETCGCETKNRYEIYDQTHRMIFEGKEHSNFLLRHFYGPLRPLTLEINDKDENCVVSLDRPFACQLACCFPCCLQNVTVFSPPGHFIGSIEQQPQCLPELHIKDEQNAVVFIIKRPVFKMPCGCGEAAFPVFASDGINECGRISKGRSDLFREAFTDADIFWIQFPPGINPYLKALLMGATFLIDYMYFENTY